MSTVLLEKRDNIAIVTLNRPEQMNALSRELRNDFCAAFKQCQADDAIRVVIVTGNGKAFCAGFDLKEMSSPDTSNAAEASENEMASVMREFDGPIIAAINGHAITGGFEIALACDVIIASDRARFADTHARVGILPGWGLSQKLPRLIGLSRAKQISFSGNPVLAQQADEWGLVNQVVAADQLLTRASQLATDMCQCVPHILVQYKALIDEGYSKHYEDALAYEAEIGITSAKAATGSIVADRVEGVLQRGRNEKH